MDSGDILKILYCPFQGWKGLYSTDLTDELPNASVVYVIRIKDGRAVGRLKGTSDIVYIGRTGKIKTRSAAHRKVRPDLRDKGWHLALIEYDKEIELLEIAFFTFEDSERVEAELLFRYFQDHLELPPVNNRFEFTKEQKEELAKDAKLSGIASTLVKSGRPLDELIRELQKGVQEQHHNQGKE